MTRPEIAIAMGFGDKVWIPPDGRPYWINNGIPNAGPHLTDKRLKRFGLIEFLKYPFNEVWVQSHNIQRLKRKRR